MKWTRYLFPTWHDAAAFVAVLSAGYQRDGITYVYDYDRPKRKKGGYSVTVLPAQSQHQFDSLAQSNRGRAAVDQTEE